jgi:PAS domain S-box-containing protein
MVLVLSAGAFEIARLHAQPALVDRTPVPLGPGVLALVSTSTLVIAGLAGAWLLTIGRAATAKRERERFSDRERFDASYAYLTRYANDMILLFDDDGWIVDANERAAEEHGYTVGELIGTHMSRLVPADKVDGMMQATHQSRALDGSRREDLSVRRDGHVFPVEVSARTFEIDGRKYHQAILRNITERRQAEARIERLGLLYEIRSELNRAIVRVSDRRALAAELCRVLTSRGLFAGAWVCLPGDGRFAPSARAGRVPEVLLRCACAVEHWAVDRHGSPTAAVCDEDCACASRLSCVQELTAGGGAGVSVVPLGPRPAGVLFIARHEGVALRETERRLLEEIGADVAFALEFLDHQERRALAESALRQSEDRFRMALDGSRIVPFTQDADLRYTWIYNTRSAPPGDLIGRTDEEIFGSGVAHVSALKREVLRTRQERRFEAVLPIGGEERTFEYWVEPIVVDGRVAGLKGVGTDVTASRALEAQLRQAQKMEAVGQLAGGVAHDFNNMLTAILGYADLVADAVKGDPEVAGDVAEIRKAAERSATITRQLLAFSRRQVLKPVVVDLDRAVRDLQPMLQRLIGEDIELEAKAEDGLRRALLDPVQFEQVIMNLAVNARDAMPGGGKLTIEVRNADLDAGYVLDHRGASEGAHVAVIVRDTGCGMCAETKKHLFEPFFTTKPKGQGTGLGLATVYGIVKQSGGSIWVYSEQGTGTVFKIFFPAAGVTAAEEGRNPAQSDELPTGRETILVAEDEASVRALASGVLTKLGYHVLAAANRDEAERVIQAHPRVNLLLSDVVMPGQSGPALYADLRARVPGLRVLYMSGYSADAVATRGLLTDGGAFLEKPFTARTLATRVREVIDAPVS